MNLQAEKKNLIHWVENMNDPNLLAALQEFKKSTEDGWWDVISDAEHKAIQEGIAQLERGEGIAHEVVMEEIKAKYGV